MKLDFSFHYVFFCLFFYVIRFLSIKHVFRDFKKLCVRWLVTLHKNQSRKLMESKKNYSLNLKIAKSDDKTHKKNNF